MAKWLCLLVLLSYYLVTESESGVSPLKRSRFNKATIKEINRKGPYLGLITVYPPEENAFFASNAFKADSVNPFVDLSGRRFRVGSVSGKRVIYVRCGVGLINAVATTQQMVDKFNIRGFLHFGIAGNLNNSMSIADVTIPSHFIHTGIWDWLNPNGTVDSSDIAGLEVKEYGMPKGGENGLGHIGFNFERLYSECGEPNNPQPLVWAKVDQNWLTIASKLQDMKLQQCVNASYCLEKKPKVMVGLKGSTADIFVDNAAFRDFLFNTFHVSSADMESYAVVMTCLSNGYPVIVIRGLSDIAGKQEGVNAIDIYGSLAAANTVDCVIRFLAELPDLNNHYL